MSRSNRQIYHSYDRGNFNFGDEIKKCNLYKYIDYKSLKEIIKNFNLLLSDPTTTNDPFEMLLTGYDEQSPILSKYRILCLSRNGSSPTMWAHYSGQHRGACLEFEFDGRPFYFSSKNKKINIQGICIEKICSENKNHSVPYHGLAYDIIYSENRVKVDRFTHNNVMNMALTLFTTKSTEWSYEQESRFIFLPKPGNKEAIGDSSDHLMPFLKRIILGTKTTNAQQKEIKSLLEQYDRPKISITRASIHRDKYKINID